MKKVLLIALLLGLALALTGCECRHPEENRLLLDKKAVRCEQDGFSGNVICVDCGEIVVPGEVVPATGHTPGELQDVVETSCAAAGYTGDVRCVNCNVVLEAGTVIEALPHTPYEGRAKEKAASCIAEGYTGDLYCQVCNGLVEQGQVLEMVPHTPGEPVNAVAANCTAEGFSGDVYCTACEGLIESGTVTEMLPHTPGEPVNAVEASCTAPGFSGEVYCSVCNAQIDTGTVIEALPHTMEGEVCSVCGWMPAGLYAGGALVKEWAALVADGEITLAGGTITAADPAITGKLVLDEGVKEIGYGAFDGCRRLMDVELNEGLEKISGRAFRYTAIKSVKMPASLVSISRDSFASCANLVKVDMSAVQGDWASLSLHSFDDCLNLEEVILPQGLKAVSGGWMELPGLVKLSLPEGLTACNLQSEYIEVLGWPVSLESALAVQEGMPNLKTIHYAGTEAQWAQVQGNESLMAAVVFNYAG